MQFKSKLFSLISEQLKSKLIKLKIFTDDRHRTIILIYLVGLFLTLSLVAFEAYYSYLLKIKEAKTESVNISRLLVNNTENIFQKIDLLLRDINRIILIKGGRYKWSTSQYNELLKDSAAELEEILALKIVDQNGDYIGESDFKGNLPTDNLRDRIYFQKQLKNSDAGLVISEPLISKTSHIWMIALSRRLYSDDNKFKGIVLATVSLKYLESIFSRLDLGPNGHVTMLSSRDKTLMARFPGAEDKLGKTLQLAPQFEKAFGLDPVSGAVLAISNIDQAPKIFGYVNNSKLDIMLITGLAFADFLSQWYRKTALIIVALLMILLVSIIILYRFLLFRENSEIQRMRLIESAKMTTLGEMAGGIAHELNNPLAIIRARAELIEKILNTPAPDIQKVLPMLGIIEKTVDRMAKIVTGLRAFSRMADEDPMTEVDLNQLIKNTLSFCSEKFSYHQINLTCAEPIDLKILCRETQISQVLLNLLSNSFDAVQDQSDKWVTISFKESSQKIQIIVTDSGPLISDEIIKKMMIPFYTSKPVGKGTGLGLSISKGIVEGHKGQLFLNRQSPNTQFICELNKNQ